MARQKKFKKMQMPKVVSGAREFIMRRIAVAAVLAVFAALAWVLLTAFFERSDYFRLKSVDIRGASDASLMAARNEILKRYKDINIFRINLKIIADSLEPRYPDAKYIIAKRSLPDKISIDLNFRRPIAILNNGILLPVDREGVVLVNRNPLRLGDLPVIKGVDPKYAGKMHKKNESRNLAAALELLDEIKKARFLDKYGVRTIDAGDVKSLSFYLGDGGPVIIIGYENLQKRLAVLRDTLKDPRLVLENINYIDVRFNDVAISPK